MCSVSDVYVRAVHGNLAPLYANWEPGRPVDIGAIGELRGDRFVVEGHLNDHEIPFDVRSSSGLEHRMFCTDDSAEITCDASGSDAPSGVSGKVNICLSTTRSVFFNAAGCKYTTIKRKPLLAQEIMQRYDAGNWDRRWVVVTDLVTASSVIVAVAGGASANLQLNVKADVGNINLSNAGVRFSVAHENSIGYKLVTDTGLPLLLGLSKIQRRWWFGQPTLRSMNLLDEDDDFDLKDSDEELELLFAQLR